MTTVVNERVRKPVMGRICWTCLSTTLVGMAWPIWGSLPDGWPRIRPCRSCSTQLSLT